MPFDETPAQLWLDRTALAGVEIGNIAYGVHITLCALSLIAWWRTRRDTPSSAYRMVAFISCTFALGTIGNGTQMRVLQLAYVDDRNYPGGPGALELYDGSLGVNVIGTVAHAINAWFADGLMLHRFHVIWSTSRCRWAIGPAVLAFVLSIISSSILLAQIADPGGALRISSSANMALTFWSASIFVTCYCTLGIAARLLWMRWRVYSVLGSGAQIPYLSITAMLVESALLYAAFALAFLITYARGDAASFMLLAILGQVQSVAPLLIIWRVAQGRGWTIARVRETELLADTAVRFRRPLPSVVDGAVVPADPATHTARPEVADSTSKASETERVEDFGHTALDIV